MARLAFLQEALILLKARQPKFALPAMPTAFLHSVLPDGALCVFSLCDRHHSGEEADVVGILAGSLLALGHCSRLAVTSSASQVHVPSICHLCES